VFAVVVDVGVNAGLIFNKVKVSDEHLIDDVGYAGCEAYGCWTEHMFVRVRTGSDGMPQFAAILVAGGWEAEPAWC